MANELILIIEDNDMNRKLARDLLQFHGYRVAEAESAETGLGLAAAETPDLVLMDIHLPGMDGIEARVRLRANPATSAVPVIAFTASVMPQDRSNVTAAGFDGFVAKPISIKEFLATVEQMLATRGKAD